MTTWIYRYYAWVSSLNQAAVNQELTQIGPEGAAEIHTFIVPLTLASFGTVLEATAAMATALETALAQGKLPSLRYYKCDALTGQLLATNSPTAGIVGGAWSWNQSLVDGGLALAPVTQLL